ncbi:hypothetical protein PR202_ga09429 [Eleusine coracana subsp. coracana]|uniref:Uncharacterized protein n=1 Tax=Eleusine coracana subsp. coracana TaxID=191504 RepID=A0AAV5C3R2_ELECO|nr:hypothetical protein PR202_ga09429 [Eleusine coracana subsp. coracana]
MASSPPGPGLRCLPSPPPDSPATDAGSSGSTASGFSIQMIRRRRGWRGEEEAEEVDGEERDAARPVDDDGTEAAGGVGELWHGERRSWWRGGVAARGEKTRGGGAAAGGQWVGHRVEAAAGRRCQIEKGGVDRVNALTRSRASSSSA